MLTTGVDAKNVRNIVLLANIGSMVEFKQIIGRGTRVYEGKDFFTIIDFVGATKLFYDPKWDGKKIEELKEKDEKEKSITIHLKGTKLKVLNIITSYVGTHCDI